jgi:hypothetical protein
MVILPAKLFQNISVSETYCSDRASSCLKLENERFACINEFTMRSLVNILIPAGYLRL